MKLLKKNIESLYIKSDFTLIRTLRRKNLVNTKQGFTLIEILLVVAILSILLVVVFAALNPAQRLADANDARRWNDVNQYLTAIHECIIDNDGDETACGLADDGVTREIVGTGIAAACDDVCTGLVADTDCEDLETELVTNQNYLGGLPADPGGVATDHTEYTVTLDSGIVTVASCSYEGTTAVTVSR